MPARIFFSAHGGEPPERRLPNVVTLRSTFATFVLVVAVVAGLVAVVESNPRHSLSQAAAAIPPATYSATSSLTSSTATSGGPTSAVGGSARRVSGPVAIQVPTAAHAVSQGQAGVIPVPLAPKAEAGPIPLLAWQAYHQAAAASGCQLPWYLLAGIGKVESDHGRFHGAQYDVTGTVHPAIFGPPTAYGRAMGPMQFIPPTWSTYATDGNHDGQTDPQNVFDATAAAAHYLCRAGGADLSGLPAQRRAVFAYNHLDSYVADVLAFAAAYEHGQPERTVHLVPITNPKPVVKAPVTTRPATSAATVKTTTTPAAAATTKTTSTAPTTTRPPTTTSSSRRPTTTTTTSSRGPTTTSAASTTPTTTSATTTAPTTTPLTCTIAPTSSATSSALPTYCPSCPTATVSSPPTSASGSPRSSPSSAATCVTPTPSETPRVISGGRLTATPSAT